MVNENQSFPASLPAELISRGAEVILMEQDAMRKFAILQRRDPAIAMETALAELKAFPELAEMGYYSIPRKSKKCKHRAGQVCNDCIRVEGASVGATRVVARCWGNCTAGVRVADETDDHWDLEGRFMDFETNFSATRGLRLLKRVKWGGKVLHVSKMDPQVEMQIFQAGVSKCFRNVVRDGVPEAILERYWRMAKTMSVGERPTRKLAKKAVKKILDAFGKHRVSGEMLEEYMGKKMDEWSNEDAARLRGIYTAIEGGETSVGQMFGETVREPEPAPMEPEVMDEPRDGTYFGRPDMNEEPSEEEPPPDDAQGTLI